jgi:hypothetical protein
MNVFAYVAAITFAGTIAAYLFGRVVCNLNGFSAFSIYFVVSLSLGFFLSFPILSIVGTLCFSLGLKDTQCIITNDQTVWFLATPLVLFPAYTIFMFIGREHGK